MCAAVMSMKDLSDDELQQLIEDAATPRASQVLAASEQGRRQGLEQGRRQGLERGRQQGLEQALVKIRCAMFCLERGHMMSVTGTRLP